MPLLGRERYWSPRPRLRHPPLPIHPQETCRFHAWLPMGPPKQPWHCSWAILAVNFCPGVSRSASSSLPASRQVRLRDLGVGPVGGEEEGRVGVVFSGVGLGLRNGPDFGWGRVSGCELETWVWVWLPSLTPFWPWHSFRRVSEGRAPVGRAQAAAAGHPAARAAAGLW